MFFFETFINIAYLKAFSKIGSTINHEARFQKISSFVNRRDFDKNQLCAFAIAWYNTCWESIYTVDCNKLWIIYDRDFFSFSFLFSIKPYCRKLSTHSCSFIKIQFLRPSASYVTKEFRHFWRSIFIFMQTWFNRMYL